MNEVILVYAVALALAWPLGRYMAAVYAPGTTVLDRIFVPVERVLYRLAGVEPAATADWRGYGKAILKLHIFIGSIAFIIFCCQGFLPLNPDGIGGMS
ncbi:MAG TPA: potassium-transporting ATPase subunit KdpA, partial [Nitrococcus sp.]|nr:potassium-transporting ATPase subunit KdpA [Nitrococcus sp.]